MKKLIQIKELGPKKKTIDLLLIFVLTVKVAGVHFLKLLVFSAVEKVAACVGLTISDPTSNEAISRRKKTSSSSSSIAFLETSKLNHYSIKPKSVTGFSSSIP